MNPGPKKKRGKPQAPATASDSTAQLERLQQQCRADATQIQQGRFRLDWERALDKIKDFQLADPHRYVLEVIQAAVAGEATSIKAYTDSDDVILQFDGRQYTRQELERLFDYLFTREAELEPLRQLALGVNAALGLKPRFVAVDSGDGQQGFRLRLSSHTDVEVTPLPADQVLDGTRVHVRDRISFKVLSRAVSEAAEVGLMRQACRHLPVPLVLQGQDLRRPEEQGLISHCFDVAGIRGELILPASVQATLPQISVLMNGVQVCQLDEDSARRVGVAVHGFVDNPALTRNASHSGIHDNEELRRTVSRVRLEARKLLRSWLKQILPQEPEGRQDALRARTFSATESHLLQQSARRLLRASRKSNLPADLDALLDVPDMVRLAIKEPPRSSLRPIWELFREHGQYHACSTVHDLAREDLPPHLLPVLGPLDLLVPIFGKPSPVDDEMGQIATREYNRRQRQKNPIEAELPAGLALVKTTVSDADGLHGEVGLCDPEAQQEVENVLADLARRYGDVDLRSRKQGSNPTVHVTYLKEGVLLGCRRLKTPGYWGVAVLDSPDFEPNAAWDDVKPSGAFNGVPEVLQRAVPGLLRQLCDALPSLPPPASLHALGCWDAEAGERDLQTFIPSVTWPTDVTARRGRQHADRLLAKHSKLEREDALWLYTWPLFYSLQGEALTLEQLLSRRDELRYVVDVPWGEGPDDLLLVNISAQQKRILQRYLPGKLVSGKRRLNRWRKDRAQEVTQRQLYSRNFSRAELRRQRPLLDPGQYLAVMDLPLPEGEGQIGIPGLPGPSHVRYLVDGVPLPEEPLHGVSVPLHAVVQSPQVQPNDDFSWAEKSSATRDIADRARGSVPALVGVLAGSPNGRTAAGAEVVWSFLAKTRTSAARPLDDLPPHVADLPLLPTVAHGQLSLREVREEALQHEHRVLYTTTEATRQLSERPILRGDKRLMKLLRRLLHIHSNNHDRPLNAEQGALAKLDLPRQAARLGGEICLRVEVTGEQISGELGLPRDALWLLEGPPAVEVKVLREGVLLCRRPVDLLDLPALGIIECPRLTTTELYSDIKEDQVWQVVRQALQAAARALVLEACGRLADEQESGSSAGLTTALQMVAGRIFSGRPGLDLDESDALRSAVAHAPIWPSADEGQGMYDLMRLAEACRGPAVLWVVGAGSGHVQPGRVIVQASDQRTREALDRIFGDEVQDGARVLRRDNAAYLRRQEAPVLGVELPAREVFTPVEVDQQQGDMTVRGQVAVLRDYEYAPSRQLLLHIGLDGRKLCEHVVPHALRGVGQLDCHGLTPNRDWNKVADQKQLKFLERLASEALWESAQELVRRSDRPNRRLVGSGGERTLMLEMLAAHPGEAASELLQAPLFQTVHGQQVSAAKLQHQAAEQGQVLVVSDVLGEGVPADGRTIIRADPAAMTALERLLEDALKRHDDVWSDYLAGQARRRETPVSAPHVSEGALERIYFNTGASSGLAGLLPLSGGHARSRSLVRLHVANRQVATRQPSWEPAVEVWINDDRLQPTLDFGDVVQDDVYWQVMTVAEAQVPEALACAAQRLVHRRDSNQGVELGQWLRLYVLKRLEGLQTEAAATPLGPASRILRAALWRCLTNAGSTWMDTAELLAAKGAGHLALVPRDADGRPEDRAVVLLPSAGDERAALQRALGELPDHGEQLRRDEAHRVFLWRREVSRVDLEAVAVEELDRHVVWRQALDHAGWEGELGLLPGAGRQLTATIFWEHRRLAVVQLPCPVQVLCAIECSLLSVNSDYSQVLEDEAYEAWERSLQAEVWTMLRAAAAALPDQPEQRRRRMRPVLLGALATLEKKKDEASRELAEVLMRAPLLLDTGGKALSVAAAVEAQDGPVAVISPRAATRGRSLDPRLVLVLDHEASQVLGRLLRLEPYDEVYLEGVEARRRQDRAPETADVSWFRTVARGQVNCAHLHGELALKLRQRSGEVWLMSGGKVVEERAFPELVGLVGFVDGKLATDSAFTKVNLNRRQEEELTGLYVDRLEQVVLLARQYRGRRWRKWRRLAAMVIRFLWYRLRETGLERGPLRDKVLARDTTLSPVVVRALDLRLFRLGDGSWVDLATVISGEDPLVVLCPKEVKRPPAGHHTLVVGDADQLRPLLQLLLAPGAVIEQARWAARRRREVTKSGGSGTGKPPQVTHDRMLSGLRSTLREAIRRGGVHLQPAEGLRLSMIKKIKLQALPRSELTRVERKGDKVNRVVVNSDHPLWKAAARAAAGAGATPIKHLTVALLGAWCRKPCQLLSSREVVRLLTVMASAAVGEPPEANS